MFTGIIQELGTVLVVERTRAITRLSLHAPKTASILQPAESVAINGVCLSLVRAHRAALTFEIIPETRRLTNLARLSVGDRVNVERSLTLLDRLSGHLLLGHIDGLGRIIRRTGQAGQVVMGIRVSGQLRRYLVPKGPVAVDGVSLTVGDRPSATAFLVFLIPETLRKTTLGFRRVGDLVNIEIDYFAKLLTQLAAHRS